MEYLFLLATNDLLLTKFSGNSTQITNKTKSLLLDHTETKKPSSIAWKPTLDKFVFHSQFNATESITRRSIFTFKKMSGTSRGPIYVLTLKSDFSQTHSFETHLNGIRLLHLYSSTSGIRI